MGKFVNQVHFVEKWSKRQELKFYFCIRAPTFSPHGFLLSKFASQIKLCNLWWGSVASHRVPFSGFHVPRSQVPRPRLKSLRVPGCRLPESRVSGPDFGLCVEHHLVSMRRASSGYLLYRGFLAFFTKFCRTNLRFPLASGRGSANEQTTVRKWSCETFELATH